MSPLALGDEPALRPQRGVLVLKNRQVIEGEVTPAGDYYLVSLGKTGQIRLAVKEVEMICRDLNEAYERKAAAIQDRSANTHIALAEWCLRQSLFDQARHEIEAAGALEPEHRRLGEMKQRLEFATTPTKTSPVAARPSTSTVSAQQLERTMKELPQPSVEHFAAVVQPILLDRCGAARCHGTGATTSFQLLQPVPGKVPSRRFTQRNLFSALTAVDKQSPEDSQLLAMSLKAHGPNKRAAFKSTDDRQYLELVEWVSSLRPVPKQLPPATVSAALSGSPRPQMKPPEFPGESQPTPEPLSPVPPAPTSDPYDPAIFNRRFGR